MDQNTSKQIVTRYEKKAEEIVKKMIQILVEATRRTDAYSYRRIKDTLINENQ